MLRCDHTSVGVLVYRTGRLLLIERQRPPYGFAPPAGHVDTRGSYQIAAAAELLEEVGLKAEKLVLIAQGRRANPCRRPGGTWHYWKIYRASARGKVRPNISEVKKVTWCSRAELRILANRTIELRKGDVSSEDWKSQPGLEPVWLDWLEMIKALS